MGRSKLVVYASLVCIGLAVAALNPESRAATRLAGYCDGVYTCPAGATVTGDYGIGCVITGGTRVICRYSSFYTCNSGGGASSACVGTYVDSKGVTRTCTQTGLNCGL